MANSFRNKVITGIILIVLCFGVGYFATTPIWEDYSAAKSQLALAQKEADNLNSSLIQVDKFIRTYEEHKSDIENVSMALPPKDMDAPGLISALNSLATASGVVLADLGFQEISNTEKQAAANSIQTVRINFTVTGTYPSFRDFMLRVESNIRISNIHRITYSSDESGLLKYQIVMDTYYQK